MADPIKPTTMLTDDETLVEQRDREELAKAVAELFGKRPWLSMPQDTDKRVLMKSQGMIPPVTDDELTIEGAFEAADYLLKRIRTTDAARIAALESLVSRFLAFHESGRWGSGQINEMVAELAAIETDARATLKDQTNDR